MAGSTTRMFNGSTLTFGGAAVAKLVGLTYKVDGAEIDVTVPEDANKLFEAGQDDLEVTAKVKGPVALTRKAKGTLAVAWSNGTTATCPGTFQVMSIEDSGDYDAPISGSIKFKPTVPDGA